MGSDASETTSASISLFLLASTQSRISALGSKECRDKEGIKKRFRLPVCGVEIETDVNTLVTND